MEPISTLTDPLQFVADLELAAPRMPFQSDRSLDLEATDRSGTGEQAFIADKSLVSFAADLASQARQDVLNSVLLAQLAANKQADIGKDLKGWYKAFISVLQQVGWVIEKEQQDRFKSKHSLFEVEEVIIEILSGAFGAGYIVLIKNTLAALKKMADKNSGTIKVFEQNTVENEKGCMQVGAAMAENDAISLQMGTFMITSRSKMKRILFFKFNKDSTDLEYASCKATLNAGMYARIRQTVEDRLVNFSNDFIKEVAL